ncbi:hypothetical protein [Catenuloplanes atrovinosus]|uniref:Uncharacterized protein n=1 Tax=Catenuloplanes atrovinosus TaxID=137266 RepID=A0AAE4CA65_9ACTN|nr:hypothetical protein [Catenuloplanes atrovinosus]MDR7277301.1 hypothetical protein [Catenuloplanes atrovinosus]
MRLSGTGDGVRTAGIAVEWHGAGALLADAAKGPYEHWKALNVLAVSGEPVVLAAAARHDPDSADLVREVSEMLCAGTPGRPLRVWVAAAGAGHPDRTGGWLTGLARRTGVTLVAPAGEVLVAETGSMLARTTSAGAWRIFRPDGTTEAGGERFPVPEWEAALPALPMTIGGLLARAVPAGVVLSDGRRPATELLAGTPRVPMDLQHPTLILDVADTPAAEAAEVAVLFARLGPAASIRWAATGTIDPHWLNELSARLGHLIPVDPTATALGSVGAALFGSGWRHLGMRVYHAGDDAPAIAEVLPGGILVRPRGMFTGGAVAMFDPRHATLTVGSPGLTVPDGLLNVLRPLLRGMPAAHADTLRLRLAGRLAAQRLTELVSSAAAEFGSPAEPTPRARTGWSGEPVAAEPAVPSAASFAPPASFEIVMAMMSSPTGEDDHLPAAVAVGTTEPLQGRKGPALKGASAPPDPPSGGAPTPPGASTTESTSPSAPRRQRRPRLSLPPESPGLAPALRDSTEEEQAAFTSALGRHHTNHLTTVNAALSTWPALRSDESAGAKTDLVAVSVYLGDSGDGAIGLNESLRRGTAPRLPGYLPCLLSGLHRLPLHRRAVLCQATLGEEPELVYPAGTVVTDPVFRSVAATGEVTVADADVDYLIWPRTARRASVLTPGRSLDEAVLPPGTRYRVLAVRRAEHGDPPPDQPAVAVLLRELPPEDITEVSAETDDAVQQRLDRRLAQRRLRAPVRLDEPDVARRLVAVPLGDPR